MGEEAQVTEHLPSKYETLGTNSSTKKNNNKKKKKKKKERKIEESP
jgi:hypothetical protein